MTVNLESLSREPELMEKVLLYCERRNIFNCISISVKINRPLNDNIVYSSLRALVLKYPLLFSFPAGEEGSIKFEPLDEILFKNVYQVNNSVTSSFKSDGSNNEILTSESFYESHMKRSVLWKLIYYKHTGWVTFHSSHSFTDGGSVVAYLKDFVEGLNDQNDVRAKKVLFALEHDLPLLSHGISPGFFSRIQYEPDVFTKIASAILRQSVRWLPGTVPEILERQRHNSFFVGCNPVPFSRSSCFESEFLINAESPLNRTVPMFINLKTEMLNKLLQKCREHHAKLSTYLIVVYAHTVLQLCPRVYKDKFLKAGVAVSFRNLIQSLQSHGTYRGNVGRFDDGFYTYGATYFLDPSLKFTWTAVKKYHDFLHDTVRSKNWLKEYYIGCQTMEAETYMGPRFEKKGDCCFITYTNLGHIETIESDDPQHFQIEDILFAPSAGATMGTHHITACSTTRGGLNIGFYNGDHRVKDWGLFRKTFLNNIHEFSGLDLGCNDQCNLAD